MQKQAETEAGRDRGRQIQRQRQIGRDRQGEAEFLCLLSFIMFGYEEGIYLRVITGRD
jgi:hypothetical protein